MGTYRLAVDTGGTFIDFVLMDERTGEVSFEKEDSTAGRLGEQCLRGVERLGISPAEIARLFHGTTVGINALVQERGAKGGLITTAGFRDVLEMGRGGRSPVYDFLKQSPPPLVRRSLRREVRERMDAHGNVLQPLSLEDVDRESDYLAAQGVEVIAIVFLHAYTNDAHERFARDRVQKRHPNIAISTSHELAAEWREYERTSTTVLNAFIRPTVEGYLSSLQRLLRTAGYSRPLAVMQSNGGVTDAKTAALKPIRTLMSGPAGGVIGAKYLSDRLGYRNVICADVGGTTYDVAIIEEGRILERTHSEVSGRAILGSVIDVYSIGAGGGSIAWLDQQGALRVGPRSAGSVPGPACFERGGLEPTATDAHLVLGHLDPNGFLGGRMRLSAERAHAAILQRIAAPMRRSVEEAALGILAIAEANMTNAIRTKTVTRGLDVRDFVLLSYGGGGGLFACAVAEHLGIGQVVIPPAPANFSAWGILASQYTEDRSRTRVMPFNQDNIGRAGVMLEELEAEATAALSEYGFERDLISVTRRLDLRFRGQEFTITIDLTGNARDNESMLVEGREAFVTAHRRLYGHGDPEAALELIGTRVRAVGHVRPPQLRRKPAVAGEVSRSTRRVRFRDFPEHQETLIVSRDGILPGESIRGPAIVNEWSTTVVIPPGWSCVIQEEGHLVISPEPPSRAHT